MSEQLIWVNEKDEVTGYGPKLPTHQSGQLHRAFSIFVLNDKDELLLQRRAKEKYHSGGLWANTCCSHPLRGETMETTIHRRLKEEMGFDCPLKPAFTFLYRADLDNELVEHEFDHVFLGRFNADPEPNPAEVEGYKWISLTDLQKDIEINPEDYVYWLKDAFPRFLDYFEKNTQR